MKQKLLLLLAISISMVSSAWADLTQIDGVYQISSADDLVAFAEIVNGGVYDANAVLTTDIDCTSIGSWTPIGSTTSTDTGKYKGTFDGQGHTIRNLTINRTGGCTGLFNTTAGVTLRNFILDSSCSIKDTNANIAGLVGRHQATGDSATETSTFYGIGNAANVTISGTDKENPAGLIGGCWGKKNVDIIIEKCWTSGTITSSSGKAGNCGAFVGWINGGKLQVNNSWSIATVNTAAAAKYLVRPASNQNTAVTFTNCRSLNGTQVTKLEGVTSADLSDLSTGGLTYALNGKSSENPVWFQTIGTDAYPVANNTHGIVYQNGTYCPDTDIPQGGFTYTNTNDHVTGEHNWDNGVCSYCGYPKANYMTANGEDFFEIDTPAQLKWFAAYVNFIDHAANAKLTDDLDMTGVEVAVIGNSPSNKYSGTFDGQGYEISNYSLTIDGTFVANYGYGMFGNTNGATIKDFTIDGDMTFTGSGSGDFGGGLVGWPDGGTLIQDIKSSIDIDAQVYSHFGGIVGSLRTATINRCEYTGTLDGHASSNGASGIAGYTNYGTITNCIFSGTLEGTGTGYFGGILGYVNNTNATIKNCLSYGQINNTKSQYATSLVARLRNIGTYSNNYYTGTKGVAGESASSDLAVNNSTKITTAQLESGEACYFLNGDQSNIVFYQTLPDDIVPTLDNTHGQVYQSGYVCPNGHPQDGTTYNNTSGDTTERPHNFVDGFCTYCETLDEDYMTPTDSYYMIGTPAQLKWFAAYVNASHPAANAKLTADINLASAEWTPIGIGSGNGDPVATAYTGTFNGQGHDITGFNAEGDAHVGLFGDANGATIQNFSISGNLTVTGGYFGGVVACPKNSTIKNVHSALIISVPNSGTHHVGGIAGSARGGNTIDGCSFSGSMTVTSSTDNFAGIVAYITTNDAVKNCVNYGGITFEATGCAAGGVVGYLNTASASILNCLNTGTVTCSGDDPTWGGAIVGRLRTHSAEKVTNLYWLEGSGYGAAKDNDGNIILTTATEATSARLSSGEVTYGLGAAFYQTIGTDTYPTLDNSSEQVYYVGAAGYTTFYDTTNDYALNGDAQAYIGTLIGGKYIRLTEIDDIPAGTAVVIGGTYYNKVSTTATANTDGNVLLGSDGSVQGGSGIYALANKSEGVGFYPISSSIYIPAGKAYLNTGAGVKGFTFIFEEEETGLKDLKDLKDLNDVIYNLSGQRISKLQKGINIVNGKKVLK